MSAIVPARWQWRPDTRTVDDDGNGVLHVCRGGVEIMLLLLHGRRVVYSAAAQLPPFSSSYVHRHLPRSADTHALYLHRPAGEGPDPRRRNKSGLSPSEAMTANGEVRTRGAFWREAYRRCTCASTCLGVLRYAWPS